MGPRLLQPHASPPPFPSVPRGLEVTTPAPSSDPTTLMLLKNYSLWGGVCFPYRGSESLFFFFFNFVLKNEWLPFYNFVTVSLPHTPCPAQRRPSGRWLCLARFVFTACSRDTCCHTLLTPERSDASQPRKVAGVLSLGALWPVGNDDEFCLKAENRRLVLYLTVPL